MGKPATSCFKIIGCGGSGGDDAVDDDDLAPKEAKPSSDKSRWSFRKKSSKHRILSNSVISEPIPVCSSKESQEVSIANFHSPRYSFPDKAKVPEKSFETSPLPVDIENNEPSSLYDRSTTPVGATINESGVTPVGATINESDVTPVGATINESAVTPVGASINESDVTPVGAIINEPDVAPVGASLNESSVSPVGATINEPDVAPVGASLNESSVSPVGVTINESDAILFQAVIRGYLARKELHQLKSLIKLQATVRGHLVRRQAVGTLRCIQAIMKMQALLRARHARQFIRKLTSPEDRKLQVNGHSFEKPSRTSTKKLLSNGFARQLLESTPRTKSFYIKCDPSKHDSTWQWLERWMAVASLVGQTDMQSFNHDNQAVEGKDYVVVPSEPVVAPMEDVVDNHLVIENVNNFDCRTSVIAPSNSFDSSLKDDVEKPESKNELLDTTIQDYTDSEIVNEETMDHVPDDKQLKPTVSSEILADTVPVKLESGKENHSDITERSSTETLENEGKRSVMSSRKSCNPAFVAAQSKFEELSLKSTVGRSASSYKNAAPTSKTESQEKQNIEINSFTDSSEAITAENTGGLHDSRVQAAASECGTEISISSTLDSPDRSEMEGGEIVLEIGVLEKENYAIIADAENAFDLINLGGDEKPVASDQTMANSNASTSLVQFEQQSAEPTASDVLTNLEGTIEQIRSPEGTPRSHIPASDLHGTPSSDVSVDAKMSKKDNNVLTHKKKSQLVDKRSPNPNNDSSGRSSTENLTKDSKIPRRRSSLAVTKADHVDQEPRLSTGNPLPGYMQATASARAKAHGSPTQKPSLDLNDNHSKKRHSFPIENGKHNSSPRMQRSASQAHQTGKGNGAHSPRNSSERKWQR